MKRRVLTERVTLTHAHTHKRTHTFVPSLLIDEVKQGRDGNESNVYGWPRPEWAAAVLFYSAWGPRCQDSVCGEDTWFEASSKRVKTFTDKDSQKTHCTVPYVGVFYWMTLSWFSGEQPWVCGLVLQVQVNKSCKCWCFSPSDQTNTGTLPAKFLPWPVLCQLSPRNGLICQISNQILLNQPHDLFFMIIIL